MSSVFGCVGSAVLPCPSDASPAPDERQQFCGDRGMLRLEPGLAPLLRAATGNRHLVVIRSTAADGGVDAARWLDALNHRGEAALADLSGDFAAVLMDTASGETLLAIDRCGIRNLYVAETPGGLVFGTSIRDVAAHPQVGAHVDAQALFNYAYFHMVPGPGTIFQGIRRLVPGEFLRWKPAETTRGRYWQIAYEESRQESLEALKGQFLSLMEQAVRAALPARGKAGAFLSGGTDSSTIAGMLSKVAGPGFDTYSIGFDAQGFDEMEYARIAARHFGTRHHEYYVTPQDIVDAVPRLGAIHQQPFGNSSAVPAYYCARLAQADGATRMLGGDGGDEIFGGNARYAKQRVFSWYEALPEGLRRGLVEPVANRLPNGVPPLRKVRSYVEQASTPMPDRADSYNVLRRFGFENVFEPDFLARVNVDQPLALQAEWYHNPTAHSLINRMLAMDMKFTLADNDLPKVNVSCELAGLPVAYPMLDDRLVAFSCRLAPELKLKGTKLRWFFKEALRDFLPAEIITKSKHGFGLPFGQWALKHGPLRELAFDNIASLRGRGLFREDFLRALPVKNAEHPNYYGNFVWVLMMLEQWFQHHAPHARAA